MYDAQAVLQAALHDLLTLGSIWLTLRAEKRKENEKVVSIYEKALTSLKSASSGDEFEKLAEIFDGMRSAKVDKNYGYSVTWCVLFVLDLFI